MVKIITRLGLALTLHGQVKLRWQQELQPARGSKCRRDSRRWVVLVFDNLLCVLVESERDRG
jgi:hypothetical protein